MIDDTIHLVWRKLLAWVEPNGKHFLLDPVDQFGSEGEAPFHQTRQLNAAFLIALAGIEHPYHKAALNVLKSIKSGDARHLIARFYLKALEAIPKEMEMVYNEDPAFANALNDLRRFLEQNGRESDGRLSDKVYAVFFPEARMPGDNRSEAINNLRKKREVRIEKRNDQPIKEPHREILFTGNALLTLPPEQTDIEKLPFSNKLKDALFQIKQEQQLYWYDHPVQIGVDVSQNEIIYGLRGLDEAIQFERKRGNVNPDDRLTCLLSVSVTHQGLQDIAGMYIKEELQRNGGLNNIDLYVFTEADARHLVQQLLTPAAKQWMDGGRFDGNFEMFGADGEYGRHYSFLKAIAALWQVCIDPGIKATFKIDLDQVFPQETLVEETGQSALEHFTTPLWGARGLDDRGRPIELGMIAGALVNESDIAKGLFTADVTFPESISSADERIFNSRTPQALSTEAEMMTRYNSGDIDGSSRCLQRIHVTGGTNGVRIDALFRHRPFTPSFIGRAEDQAYILPALFNEPVYLGYVHKAGLIMRHDKEAFAGEAIKHAYIGKLIGDYIRILYFSEYGRCLNEDLNTLKDRIDPFTGCFVSKIPRTVVYLRFALKAASFFASERFEEGDDFVKSGTERISKAMAFTGGEPSPLKKQYQRERRQWRLYYQTLSRLARALKNNDDEAVALKSKAQSIINACRY